MNVPIVPTNVDFSKEVRADRLSLLWKITLILAVLLVWATLILTALSAANLADVILPLIATVTGCLICRALLNTDHYQAAVWAFSGGLLITIGMLSYTPATVDAHATGRDLVPFLFPLVIFIIGLLLPFRSAIVGLMLSIAITAILPMLSHGAIGLSTSSIFAIAVILLSAGIAAQMSGDLYGIAEWALANYRRERDAAARLYDTQQEIQRSLLRTQALNEAVKTANIELEGARAAALEAKNFRGQFLANMSHELRTPLNAIIGFSEAMVNYPMMYSNVPLPSAYRQDLDQINNSGKQLLALINDILDLSKVDAGRLDLEVEKVDAEEMIKYVMAQSAGLKGDKPIKFRRDAAEPVPFIRGDSLRIRQVMLNLLSNAAKFTDEGTITVGTRPQEDGTVLFWVADSGIGIPPQDMDKIFEEFRQGTSGRRKGRAGSGLGLAIARQLLGLMNGKIWAESKLGEGSTFYFTLPIYTEADETFDRAQSIAQQQSA
jgi:signal transduction histidine kinase